MVLTISRQFPSAKAIAAFLQSQSKLGFSYAAVGATNATPPAGHVVDHNRVKLGEGAATLRAARGALEKWTHFNLGWVEAKPREASLRTGALVAVIARHLGLHWLMACRIVYLIDEERDSIVRFGFAYGTLPAHAEQGEERFMIEWNRTDDTVWYDLLAFSRPNGLLPRLGYP